MTISSFKLYECNEVVKNKCIPSLETFIHNGQFSSIKLAPGESSQTLVSFYSGHTYRIAAFDKTSSANTYFQVKTPSNQLLYSSKDKGPTWDFKVESSRKLIIDVISDKTLQEESCIGVVVGFKDT